MILYNIGLLLYALLIKIASSTMPKAKFWCDGRRYLFERLKGVIRSEDRIIWIHTASLGEFEQGRPIIEKVREQHPGYRILLTFFSPSGYEIRKDYPGADYIFYLPLDTTRNARRFLDIVKPEIAIFVKYEYWLNLLFELRRRKIQSYIVSAIFRKRSIFFKWWGFMWRSALRSFNTIFVQDEESKAMLAKIKFHNVVVAGDTRFDRVAEIASQVNTLPTIERFKGESELFVAGSTWPADEALLLTLVKQNPNVKFVIAPHEIDDKHIFQIEDMFGDLAIRYTEVTQMGEDGIELTSDLGRAQVLILDTMGMLSSLYQYGDWAYIGGGFGVGIHNTLEAAIFGLPIAFGTNYDKFKEARDLVSLGACTPISDKEELSRWFSPLLNDPSERKRVGTIASDYTMQKRGATNIILSTIFRV